MARGNDIVIKSGSVEIDFDPEVYRRSRGAKKGYWCTDRKIVGVEIKDEKGEVVPQVPKNGQCTIRILIKHVKITAASRKEPTPRKRTSTALRPASSRKAVTAKKK